MSELAEDAGPISHHELKLTQKSIYAVQLNEAEISGLAQMLLKIIARISPQLLQQHH